MKTVLKWNPYLDCELSAQEGWLEELSREGLSVRCRFGPLDVAEWRGMRRTCRRLEEGETAPLPPARRLGLLKGAVTLAGLLLLILTLALIIAVLPLLILEVPL